ncbi:MAG TPA: GNAT family N-acetyltransferase [Candidatus Acidoferrum sp.]|nr:GNAT family N-acetyltransferase [Candidatus Acidoferrum sp.]
MHPTANQQDGYVRFIEAQGLPVFAAQGSLWVEKRKFFYESIPQHRRVHLRPQAAARLFRGGAAVLRYTCEEHEGDPSFEYVCSQKPFSLEALSSDARRRVRRGLESCEIRPADFTLLAERGCAINRSTLERQGRSGVEWMTDEAVWRRYMTACAGIPNVHALGAFVEGQLCGYSMAVTVDDYAYLYHTQALSEYLKYSPVNALTYAMTKAMLECEGIQNVSQGLESFQPLPEVEKFKLGLGFRKRALGRKVVINPLARPLFSSPAIWLAKNALAKFKPGLAEDFATFTTSLRNRATTLSRGEASSGKSTGGNL